MNQKAQLPTAKQSPNQTHNDDAEKRRLHTLTHFEREARRKGFRQIAGIDEAGRGPLAGPVVAAACIIPEDIFIPGVDDSKKLTPKQRACLFEEISNNTRIVYGVGIISSEVIDEINILQATIRAMYQAILSLIVVPDLLLVDGMDLKHEKIPCRKIVQGDAKSQSIAAASIIAKETRDRLMEGYHSQWPQFGFHKHKGYGTEEHRQALIAHGPCPIHRRTFEPVKGYF